MEEGKRKLGRPVGADGARDYPLHVRVTKKEAGLARMLASRHKWNSVSEMIRELIRGAVIMEYGTEEPLGWKKWAEGQKREEK
jgi:hypothetical protein